jgi:very-short-patch-repair endonuclease
VDHADLSDAEQVRVQPNLYDVVIVDEASQAGLEAAFLQYLAPKIVVIGDDKQVSPSAVGVDQQQLRDLANQFLATDPYRASWLDPKRSYFDEASMRFGGRITLIEHRRCVPEIIGFSNRVAYEPEGIRLVPVRQFGAERLDPIRVVHLTDGYEADNKTNVVEAEAIVDQICKCIAEPQYDGKTIGVISLLGREQALLIEHKLLDAVPPDEWTARDLRCGDASDFQGSERDIMFLSMVKAPSEKRRLTALTATQYVQRYNVAASRAKDQMWVYHSMAREDLTNPEDMRYQLLDYCYGVLNRTRNEDDGTKLGIVPEDVLVAPFDSLFEQRVYNRIVDRGYTVHAQYPAQGYNIDMVIIGAKGKLAVECDGDFWHGAAAYEADLARQRELERCGWEFFRIRESIFYADMAGSLAKLWNTLDELDIRTADWIDPKFGEDITDEMVEVIEDVVVDDLVTDIRDASSETFSSAAENAFGAWLEELPTDHDDDHDNDDAAGIKNAVPEHFSTRELSKLQPYVTFDEPLPGVAESRLDTVSTNIAKIVAAEGPVLGERLHQAYAKAAGTQAVGKKVAHVLNQAITSAERRGMIISDNPLGEAGVKPRTFRLATQPEVVARELGPRPLALVPPAELAHHLSELYAGSRGRTEEEVFDEVRRRFGLERFNENARAALERASALVQDDSATAPSMS